MNVKVNVRLLVLLLIGTVSLSIGVYFLHEYQNPRNALALLSQADRAEEKGELPKATRFLARYLRFMPHDVEARVRFGQLLDKHSSAPRTKSQVIEVFEQVLIHDPQRHDVRRRLATLSVEVGLIDEAVAHLTTLQELFPTDAEVLYELGRCQEFRANYAQAATLFEAAIHHAPQHVNSYQRRAHVLQHRLDDLAGASAIMEQLIKANPESVQARLVRWRFLRDSGKADAAAEEVKAALRLAPDQADVRLAAADSAQAKGNPDEARQHLEAGLAKNGRHLRLYQMLAGLEVRLGRSKEAAAVLRRGLEALPRQPDLLLHLADLLIDNGDLAGARGILEELQQVEITPFRRIYVDARVQIREGKFQEAAALLENIRPQAADEPSFTVQLDLLLGQCYEALNDGEKQIAVYRRALTVEPTHVVARQGLATALANQGRVEEAFTEFQRLVTMPRASVQNYAPLAQLMILRTLRQPEGQRQWAPVEQILEQASKALPDSMHIPILWAELRVAQNKPAEARQILEQARDRHKTLAEPWLALAMLAERQGQPAEALALLDEAEKQLGDRVALRQSKLQLAVQRGGSEGLQRTAALEQGRDRFSPAERGPLLVSLGQAYSLLGKPADAQRLWRELAELQPREVTAHTLLFDLALKQNDEETMQQALDALLKLEGANGLAWQWGELCRRFRLAQRGDKGQLPEVKRLLTTVAARRPNWSRPALYWAYIEELEGNTNAALENYRRAIDMGDRQPETVRRTAQLLNERQRFTEADALIRRLGDPRLISADLQKMSAELALRSVDNVRALELAQKAVPTDSKDPHDQIWLGQVLWAAGRKAEAETALRRALELNSQIPEPWVALALFHVHSEQLKEAEAIVEKAQQEGPKTARLAWAQCYEILRQPERAYKLYQTALQEKPNDLGVMRAAADFLLRSGRAADTQALLRRMLDPRTKAPPAEAAWARRALATLLTEGDYRQYREAQALIEENLKLAAGSPEDLRAKAVVLGSRPHSRRQAIAILEELFRKVQPTPDQQFFLAQLHDADRNWPLARQWLLGALAVQPDHPLYLVHYVRGLLTEGAAGDAEQWLLRLEKVRPRTFDSMCLRARSLVLHDKAAEAVAFVRDWTTNPASVPADGSIRMALAAGFLEELGQRHVDQRRVLDPPTEEFYRKLAADAGKPSAVLELVRYLGRRQRLHESLELCEAAWKTCPPEAVAEASVGVLHAAPPSPQQIERVERWLRIALDKNPKSLPLLLCLADLRDSIQGRYAEAETAYTQILTLDADYVIALNNFAYLLALKGTLPARALEFIERALSITGPTPELLDTRAVVHLAMGQHQQALQDLEAATAATPSAAMYFHLAQAHWQARNRPAALLAWTKACSAGLEVVALHPIERETYRKLQGELEAK